MAAISPAQLATVVIAAIANHPSTAQLAMSTFLGNMLGKPVDLDEHLCELLEHFAHNNKIFLAFNPDQQKLCLAALLSYREEFPFRDPQRVKERMAAAQENIEIRYHSIDSHSNIGSFKLPKSLDIPHLHIVKDMRRI